MQHLNLIDENQTIYESLAILNNNFQSLLSCMSGATAPVADSNTPIAAGTLWYNTTENRVYQMDYNSPANWVLVSDLSGTGTTKEYVDNLISTHNHDSTYLKLNAPAKDVQFVNGKPADTVIYKSNISDVQGTSDRYIAPSSRLFEATRQQVRAFIDTLGNPDEILKQLEEILQLIRDNQGDLDNLGIDNISGLRVALDGKMPLATTLEDLGGVRADGGTVTGFTGRILFNKTSAIANGGVIAVGREGVATTLHAVSMWDDGGTNPDAVQIGDNTAPTYINALSPDDAFIAVGGTTRHKIWSEGNIAALDTVLAGRDFMKEAAADLKYLRTNGKAVDSALLNGVAESTAQSNNTIVKRNGAGDIITRYFRTNAGAGTSSDANYFLVQRATGTGGDNYARPVSAANVKNALGIQNLPNWTQAEFDSRYVNVSGDTVTGNFTVNGTFFANNFCVKDLPEMQMGNGGVNDEYLIIARRYTGTPLDASGLAGHFKFHRGSSTKTHAISDIFIVLSIDNNHDAIGLFDQYGTPIFDSIDAITVGGVAYYAVKIRGSGGGDDATFWQFEGQVINNINDSRILTRVRLSDSNVTFVSTKWNPASAINSFNLRSQGSSHFLLRDGTNNMTGDVKINNDKFLVNIGRGGIRRNIGKIILCDHNNGNVTLSAGGNTGNLYIGYNSGSDYQTSHVRLESDLYTKSNSLLTIDASTGQLFDEGERVYSPKNNSAIAVLNRANKFTSTANEYNGHHYFTAYNSAGNHYPHYRSGSDGTGAIVQTRVYRNASQYRVFELNGKNGGITWNGYKVWNSGNDGSGSGLDADRLDGVEGSAFARSDGWDNVNSFEFLGGISLPNKTPGSAQAWNKDGNIPFKLTRGNNSAGMWLHNGATTNSRHLYIQSGHSDSATYAAITGQISLNPFGGQVNVNQLHVPVGWTAGVNGFGQSIKLSGSSSGIYGTHNGIGFHNNGNMYFQVSGSNYDFGSGKYAGYMGPTLFNTYVDNRIQKATPILTLDGTADLEGGMGRIEFHTPSKQNVQLRHNAHDSTRAPYGLHIEKTTGNSQQSLKAYLDVEGNIYSNNARVLTTADEGSGKGIDADTVDGRHASAIPLMGTGNSGGNDVSGTIAYFNRFKRLGSTHGASPSYSYRWYPIYQYSGTSRTDVDIEVLVHGDANYWTGSGTFRVRVTRYSGEAAGINHVAVTHVSGYKRAMEVRSTTSGSTGTVWIRSTRQWGDISARLMASRHNKGAAVLSTSYTESTPSNTIVVPVDAYKDGDNNVLRYNTETLERLYLGSSVTSLRSPIGTYGSVSCEGRVNGWSGFSIEGRMVFMHDGGNAAGIYNDVDNEWMFLGYRNGETRMYHNGTQRITATSAGANVSGTLTAGAVTCGGDLLVGNSSSNRWKIDTDSSNHLNIADWSGRKAISMRDADSVELYYNNVRKTATTSSGFHVYGDLSGSGTVRPPHLLKLLGSRTTTGTWTLNGVKADCPVYLFVSGRAYFRTLTNIWNTYGGTIQASIGGLSSSSRGLNNPTNVLYPRASQISISVSSLASGTTLRAYQ